MRIALSKLHPRRTPAAAASLVFVALAIAGCGGSSSGGSSHGQANVSSDTRTAAQLSADRRLAHRALLRLSDFPDGWTSKPSSKDNNDDRFGKELAKCLGVPNSLLGSDTNDSVDSPDFDSPDNQEVSSSVIVGPSADEAETMFSLLEKSNAAHCFRVALNDELHYSMTHGSDAPKDVQLGQLTFSNVNLPQFADESVAYRAAVPVTARGLNVEVDVDLIFMRHGRAATFVSFLDVFSPFPVAQEKHYARIAADRLSALNV